MRRSTALVVLLALAAAAPLRAQEASPSQEQLQRLVEERFAARVRERLGLSDDQFSKLLAVNGEFSLRRRTLEAQERLYRAELAEQLRPGGTPDQKRVAELQQELFSARQEYLKSFQDETARLDFLNPAQRAQFFSMREALQQRVRELRQARLPRLRGN